MYSGMLYRVALVRTDASYELSASFLRFLQEPHGGAFGGGGAFLRGVGSCGGRAVRHPEDAVLLCYISFLTSFSFFSVVFCSIYI
jgi:hypothetical protein